MPAGWVTMTVNKTTDLPNEGREASSFAYAIRHLYEDPPPLVAFVQGNPFDACPTLFEDLQEPCREFRWLGSTDYVSEANGSPHDTTLSVDVLYERLTGKAWPGKVRFAAGGQFILPGAMLHRYPPSYYQDLEQLANMGRNPWNLERLWEAIFT
jgi:hypothetical protein